MKTVTAIFTFVFSIFLTCSCVAVSALELQGVSTYQRLNNDMYIAAVYTDNRSADTWLSDLHPLRMDMIIVAEELSPRRFYRLWNEGLAINLTEAEMNARVAQVTGFMRLLKADLVKGDRVSIVNNGSDTRISINGVLLQTVDDPGFAKALLTAWVGKYPRTQQFKQDLIAMQASERSARATELAMLVPAEGRVAVIEQWRKPKANAAEMNKAVAVAQTPAAVEVAGNTASAEESNLILPANEILIDSSTAGNAGDIAAVSVNNSDSNSNRETDVASTTANSGLTTADSVAVDVTEQGTEATEATEATDFGSAESHTDISAVGSEQAVKSSLNQQEEAEPAAERLLAVQIAQQQAEAAYYRGMLMQANALAKYPKRALQRGLEGSPKVIVVLDRSGNIIQADISDPSGHKMLDHAALHAARKAAPYAEIPALLEGDEFEFDIPFRFVMNVR